MNAESANHPPDDIEPSGIENRVQFAQALTALRERAGLTVRQMARATGIQHSTLGGYFSGRHLPQIQPATVLEDILRVCSVTDAAVVKEWNEALRRLRRLPGQRTAGQAPYLGLRTFQTEDAQWFYGRDDLVSAMLHRLGGSGPGNTRLLVVGPSGSGKSSLLRAGLIPALCGEPSATPATAWSSLLLTPGPRPLRELANQLAMLTGDPAADLHARLVENPRAFGDLLGSTHDADGETHCRRTLIVVDQFEELFTACEDETERHRFVDALWSAATPALDTPALDTPALDTDHPPRRPPCAVVVLGMRADFYTQALRLQRLAPVIEHAQFVVGPMTEEELRQAIVEPARKANLSVEPGLVEVLLHDLTASATQLTDDAAHEPGALPLLSHALLATWEQARNHTLTIEHYRATGGIYGAVAKTAESSFAGLTTPRQREIARRLFLRLVRADDDVVDTRRSVPYHRLFEDCTPEQADTAQEVLDQFVAARLITAGRETITIAHEALLTAWPRLRQWLDADAGWRRFHHRLIAASAHWQETGHDADSLYRGAILETAREWTQDSDRHRELDPREREFLTASLAQQARQQTRERRRVRRHYQVMALVTVLTLVAAGAAVYARQLQLTRESERSQATRARSEALSRLVAGKADRLRDKDVSLSAQLALAAYRIAATPEARSSLLNSTAVPAASRLISPAGAARALAVSQTGDVVAAGLDQGPIQLWTVDRGGKATPAGQPLRGVRGMVLALVFSPDRRLLAAGGYDRLVHLWDTTSAASPRSLGSLTGPKGEIRSLAVSPDGRVLAAAGADGRAYLWHIANPALASLAAVLPGSGQAVRAVAFTPDGRTLATAGHDSVVRLWDVTDPSNPALRRVLTGPAGKIFCLAISPDGRRIAAGLGAEHSVYVWDLDATTAAANRPAVLAGPASWVNTVAFSPDGRTLAAGSSDNLLWLFDVATRQPVAQLPHPSPLAGSGYRTDRSLATVADDGAVRLWVLPGPVITGARDSVFNVSFDATGHRLGIAPGATDNTLTVWDAADPQHPAPAGPPLVNTPGASPFSGSGTLTPDGRIFVVGCLDGTVQLWDISGPASARRIGQPFPAASDLVESVTVSGDGSLLAVSSDDATVRLLDISRPRQPAPLATLTASAPGAVFQAVFSPDQNLLAMAGNSRRADLWDITHRTRPRLRATLGGFTDAAYSVAFSPDGKTLAVGSADSTVRLWNVGSPAHPTSLGPALTGPVGYINSLAFNSRNVLATGSSDNTIWLWDLTRPGRPSYLATLTGAVKPVLGVAFSPDGRTLAAGGHDHAVRLWNTDPGAVAARLCATVGRPLSPEEWKHYIPGQPYAPPCA